MMFQQSSYPVLNLSSPSLGYGFLPEFEAEAFLGRDRFPITKEVTLRNKGEEVVVRAGIDPGMGEVTPINLNVAKSLRVELGPMGPDKKAHQFYGRGVVDEVSVNGTTCSQANAPVQALKAVTAIGDEILLGTSFLGAVNATLRMDMKGSTIVCSETPHTVDMAYVKFGTVAGRPPVVDVLVEKDGKTFNLRSMMDPGVGDGLRVNPEPWKRLQETLGLTLAPDDAVPQDARWLRRNLDGTHNYYNAPKVSIKGIDGTAENVLVRHNKYGYQYDFDAILGYDFYRKAGTTMKFGKEGMSISLGQEKGFLGIPTEAWAAALVGGVLLYAAL